MSAFALVVAPDAPSEADARTFIAAVARAKGLSPPSSLEVSEGCLAAKLDGPTSRHRGVIRDRATDSWMLVAGTLVPPGGASQGATLEALLADFLARGAAALTGCEGQFSLVVRDGRRRMTSVATDPLGYFGVFVGEARGSTFVSTAALPIAGAITAHLDELGVGTFLRAGKVFGEQTLWRGVERIPPATVVTFGPDGRRSEIYWRARLDSNIGRLSLTDIVDGSGAIIIDRLRHQLAGEGTMWSDLTGGFDTRLLVMSLDRAGLPFEAEVVGPDDHADVRIARRVASALGRSCERFHLPADWVELAPDRIASALGHGDGHLDVLATLRALWVHEQEAGRHPLLLSGMGGELWRGPIWWPERRGLGRATEVHYDRQLWSIMHPVDEAVFARPDRPLVRADLIRRFRSVGEQEPDEPNTAKLDRLWLYREVAHAGAWLSLGAGIIRIMTPLFSPAIVEYAMSVDPRWRSGNHVVRHLFERSSPALSAIEVEGRGPAGPIRLRTAHRFLPSRLARLRRMADKAAQVTFDRRLTKPERHEGFDRVAWRRSIVATLQRSGALDPSAMVTADLYDRGRLASLLARAPEAGFGQEPLLGRIVTVELAARAVGRGIS